MHPLTSAPAGPLAGTVSVPGDKSISHRALLLGALAVGETRIDGLLEGEDVRRTAAAITAMGARVWQTGDGVWRVSGVGTGGLSEPDRVLDMGNSGTAARLLSGILASHDFTAFVTGDASLRGRPMDRVIEPLSAMGASFVTRSGGRLPMAVRGACEPLPLTWETAVPSAQVKSAILLAGLNAPGRTAVTEARATRDHTERMLRHFGAALTVTVEGNRRTVTLEGQPELEGREIAVPGDPSSAAFPLVAALLLPGSAITVRGVGTGPLRTGLFETLREMGADLTFENERQQAGEPVADITARAGNGLRGVTVPADRAPSMIDEYPVLAVAAAAAKGTTRFEGIGELRVKESDRLAAIADGLAVCGVETAIAGDTLAIEGAAGPPPGPAGDAVVRTGMDHRIAMAFLVMGLVGLRPVCIDDGDMIGTSFPGFIGLMNGLGANITETRP